MYIAYNMMLGLRSPRLEQTRDSVTEALQSLDHGCGTVCQHPAELRQPDIELMGELCETWAGA